MVPVARRGRGISRRQKGIRERGQKRCRVYPENPGRGEFQTQKILWDVAASLSSEGSPELKQPAKGTQPIPRREKKNQRAAEGFVTTPHGPRLLPQSQTLKFPLPKSIGWRRLIMRKKEAINSFRFFKKGNYSVWFVFLVPSWWFNSRILTEI